MVDTNSLKGLFEGLTIQGLRDPALLPPRLLAIDPGETTGWCLITTHDMYLEAYGQINTSDGSVAPNNLSELFHKTNPSRVIMEDYRVYQWKAKDHAWNALLTPRVIGMVEMLCYMRGILNAKQSAQTGKGFMTDERLKDFGLYQKGQRHSRDAMRHACQYLLFHSDFKPAINGKGAPIND